MNKRRMFWLTLVFAVLALTAGFAAYARPSGINCKIVSCPAPMCEDNEHLERPAGACCPICVPN